MKDLNKPIKRQHESHYDYHECIEYIEKKNGYETREYPKRGSKPYLDFWHWVLENAEISNGCYFKINTEWLDSLKEEIIEKGGSFKTDWRKRIVDDLLKEFGTPDNDQDELVTIRFWVEW